jgi:hypothetical protein
MILNIRGDMLQTQYKLAIVNGMSRQVFKFVPQKFLPWGSIWLGTVLFLLAVTLAAVGSWAGRHTTFFLNEIYLGRTIFVQPIFLPSFVLASASLEPGAG